MKWSVLLVLIIVAVFAAACSDPAPGEHDEHGGESRVDEHGGQGVEPHEVIQLAAEMLENIEVRTASATLRVLPAELLTTGRVDFEQDRLAHVTPRIPGRVEAVHADLGDQIRKGEVLTVIDSIELGQAKSGYLQARAREELALQNFEREAGLFAEHISSEKEMLVAKAAALEALARLRSSEETLRLYGLRDSQIKTLRYEDGQKSLLPVRSPLSGRVVEKHVTVGELVTPGQNLFTVADLSRVWIWIDVYERDLGQVHLEDDVVVAVDAYPNEAFGGKVSYLSAQVDVATRTVRARIDVENDGHKLRPGMFARVTLTDPHSESSGLDPSLVVPTGAVQRDGEEFVVFVSLGSGRFERREVEPGRRTSRFTEILAGLDPMAEVVVDGGFLLKSEASKERLGTGHDH